MKIKNGFRRIGQSLTLFAQRTYRAISRSFIGRLFSSYAETDRLFHNSALMSWTSPKPLKKKEEETKTAEGVRAETVKKKKVPKSYAVSRALAEAMDKSALRRGMHALANGLLGSSLRTLGVFFLVSGVYSAMIAWLIASVWLQSVPDGVTVFVSACVALFGALLLLSDRSLGHALYKGRLTGALLHSSLGVSSDLLQDVPEKGRERYAVAVPFGMLIGSITGLTGPLYPAVAILLLLLTMLVLSIPESGIFLLLLFTPFVGFLPHSELWVVLGVLLCVVGYFCKLLRGTRVFHMEVQDFAVLLLLVFTLFTGVSAAGGSAWKAALLSAILMLIYFPAVNILATPSWLQRCRWGLLFATTAASLIGILQFLYALLIAMQGIAPISMNALGAAVRAGFADNGSFAYFLVIAFPFALHAFLRAKTGKHRATAGFSCLAALVATVLTWSQGAWLALIVEVAILVLLCKKSVFPYVLVVAVAIPIVLVALPEAYTNAFFAFLRDETAVAGSDVAAKLFFEQGSGIFSRVGGIKRLFFGVGMDGLERVMIFYTAAPAAQVVGAMNFWWMKLFEGGLLGLLFPITLFFFLLQNCFSLLPYDSDERSAVAPASGISMVVGTILIGFFDYAWLDPAAMLLFFLLIAILTADARYRRRMRPDPVQFVQSNTCFEMDYTYKDKEKRRKRTDEKTTVAVAVAGETESTEEVSEPSESNEEDAAAAQMPEEAAAVREMIEDEPDEYENTTDAEEVIDGESEQNG